MACASLLSDIFQNISEEFALFRKAKFAKSLIQKYFSQLGIRAIYAKNNKGVEAIGQISRRGLNGWAFVLYSKGESFFGLFKENCKAGPGIRNFSNGLTFKGEYADDMKTRGILYDSTLYMIVYDGEWRNDMFHGYGLLRDRRKRWSYCGQFSWGRFEGEGVKTWMDGGSLEGRFHKGEPHGWIRMRCAEGAEKMGYFRNGVLRTEGQFEVIAAGIVSTEEATASKEDSDSPLKLFCRLPTSITASSEREALEVHPCD